jgi:hypothetical protein
MPDELKPTPRKNLTRSREPSRINRCPPSFYYMTLMQIFVATLLIIFTATTVIADEQTSAEPAATSSPTVKTVPELDQFLIIPLRIYRLKSTDLPAANCALTDRDFQRIVGKVNRVWAYGGVYFGLESIVEETAATDRLLRLPEKKDPEQAKPQEKETKTDLPQEKQKAQKEKTEEKAIEKNAEQKAAPKPPGQGADQLLSSRLYRAIIPPGTRDFPGFRVYYIHQFDVNGIYYGRREAMVKETARLRQVPGGIDEPIPRVTSHELGHGLTLPHRQDNTNLMASGTTGTTFNEAEVAQARKAAQELPATIKYADLEKPDAERSEAKQKQRAEWANDLREIVKEFNRN